MNLGDVFWSLEICLFSGTEIIPPALFALEQLFLKVWENITKKKKKRLIKNIIPLPVYNTVESIKINNTEF
jgi:hypothetical protein